MVLSWTIFGSRSRSVLLHKFPFAVISSINFAYDESGRNLTLEKFQEELVKSLQKAADPRVCYHRLQGYSLRYCCGRGDWKFKSSWLRELRDYSKVARADPTFCRRCLCTSNCADRHWLDVKGQSWNNPAITSQVLDANIPRDLPFPGSSIPLLCFALFCGSFRTLRELLSQILFLING